MCGYDVSGGVWSLDVVVRQNVEEWEGVSLRSAFVVPLRFSF